MTIEHHPEEATLAAYAAGALDLGQHVALATHLRACPQCRDWVRAMERLGGALLADSPEAELSAGALAKALARLDEPPRQTPPEAPETADAPPELPTFVRRYTFGPWRFVAPRVRMRPIHLPEPSPTRVFLLKSAPDTTMLTHEHTALEMTCVLRGAFRHAGGRFGPGDFDLGDETVQHRPQIESGEDCVCLVAMQGELRWSGFWGRLAQPFVRL
jgi:putative transcriptional regulator